jgi:hypothetical protein
VKEGIYEAREMCNTGYIGLKDIKRSIPELTILGRFIRDNYIMEEQNVIGMARQDARLDERNSEVLVERDGKMIKVVVKTLQKLFNRQETIQQTSSEDASGAREVTAMDCSLA